MPLNLKFNSIQMDIQPICLLALQLEHLLPETSKPITTLEITQYCMTVMEF